MEITEVKEFVKNIRQFIAGFIIFREIFFFPVVWCIMQEVKACSGEGMR